MKKNCIACIEYWHCKRPQKGITVHDCSFFNDGGAINQKNRKDDFDSDPSENSKNQENTFYHQGSIEVKPRLDRSTERLILDVEEKINDMVVNHYKEVVNFKDKAVKDALIALGWKPPELTPVSGEKQRQKDYAVKVLEEHNLKEIKQNEIPYCMRFMGIDITEFSKEELIKIISFLKKNGGVQQQ